MVNVAGYAPRSFSDSITLGVDDISTDGSVRIALMAQVLAGSRSITGDPSNGITLRAHKMI